MSALHKLPLSIRPEVENLFEYKPGLSIDQIKRQYGISSVIKLASNENPWGSSPKALMAYKKETPRLFRYPDSRSVDLRRMIGTRHQLDWQEVIVGAGSDEIIELLAKAFLSSSDDVVVSDSAFLQYKIAAELMGARVISVPMKEMTHDLMGMADAVTTKTKFVFIANPNNPTGTYVTRDNVGQFLNKLPSHVMPVFDEAYFEYAQTQGDYPSIIREFFRKRSLVVLRTFSKIYGLAGLRVGYGVAPESVIRILDRIRPPFNVSIPAQRAAQAALYDDAFVNKSVKSNAQEMVFVSKGLKEMGFDVVASAGNFLLFHVRPWTGRILFERLIQKGVIVRSVDEYGLPNALRVTVGMPKENKIFLKALGEVIKEK